MAYLKIAISKNELERLYVVERQSLKTIGLLYNVSAQTILNRLNEYGIQTRNSGDYKRGKPHSELHKQHLSEALKGRHLSTTTKRKLSWAHSGKKLSPEHVAKISGVNSPCYGRTGAKHPMWKGGISTEQNRLRQSYPYKQWRRAVFKRDGWLCRICSINKGYVQGHHIVSFKTLFETQNWDLMWDIDNGLTVCRDCHKKIHDKEVDVWQYIPKKPTN